MGTSVRPETLDEKIARLEAARSAPSRDTTGDVLAAKIARLEASGGLTFDVAREVAATGVDYLAVGALTHSAPVLDIGADLRTES